MLFNDLFIIINCVLLNYIYNRNKIEGYIEGFYKIYK